MAAKKASAAPSGFSGEIEVVSDVQKSRPGARTEYQKRMVTLTFRNGQLLRKREGAWKGVTTP